MANARWLADALLALGDEPGAVVPDDRWVHPIPDSRVLTEDLAVRRETVRLACSDADEYSREGTAAELYGVPLGLDVDLLPGARHLSDTDGYGSWPAVLAWCLDASTRLAPR